MCSFSAVGLSRHVRRPRLGLRDLADSVTAEVQWRAHTRSGAAHSFAQVERSAAAKRVFEPAAVDDMAEGKRLRLETALAA